MIEYNRIGVLSVFRTTLMTMLVATVFVAGCNNTDYDAIRTERAAKVPRAVKELVGKTEKQLVARMGVPKNSYEFGGGGRILNFVRVGGGVEGYSADKRCEVQTTLDKSGIVIKSTIVEWHRSIIGSNVCLVLLGKRRG